MSARRFDSEQAASEWLLTPAAIRDRCTAVLRLAEEDRLHHWHLDRSQLSVAADEVITTIHADYPDLNIPMHSRWRHFVVQGVDRWGEICASRSGWDPGERARTAIDLVITSVLLDAGAGAQWQFIDPPSGTTLSRSEGLAAASLQLFFDGHLSATADTPLRCDADALARIDAQTLCRVFQVTDANPLTGVEGRLALLHALGAAVRATPRLFGADARLGNLYDHLLSRCQQGTLAANEILAAVLTGLGSIWPGRVQLADRNLGDCWPYPALGDTLANSLVPFHKLSQWLSYSLVEPLQQAGVTVVGLDELTGLAEYRNGGLLVDCGVLVPRVEDTLVVAHEVGSPLVVEWRALTVALIDELAVQVRAQLDLTPDALPLIKVLQGGTWSAGRRIARARRPDGGPPLRIISDGTVF